MIDLIERIGPILGIVAFLGLAILAFLIFQQAREVRRLREWAGRAPERAAEAAEASLAAAEARGESVEVPEDLRPSRVARLRERLSETLGPRWRELDRRLPVDPRYLIAVLVAAVVAAGVLTNGFGVFAEDEGGGGGGGKAQKQQKVEVAVLNATQSETSAGVPIQGVPGLAGVVAERVLEPAGYRPGREADAVEGLSETVIMFDEDASESEAEALAEAVRDELGETTVAPMIEDVRDLAGGASLALVIGQDDAELGQDGGSS